MYVVMKNASLELSSWFSFTSYKNLAEVRKEFSRSRGLLAKQYGSDHWEEESHR